MKTTNQKAALEAKIILLKSKQSSDFLELMDQYHATIDSFKPINLIKNTLVDTFVTSNLKANLISGAIGFGTRYLTQNVLDKNSENPVKRVLAKILEFVQKGSSQKHY